MLETAIRFICATDSHDGHTFQGFQKKLGKEAFGSKPPHTQSSEDYISRPVIYTED